MPTYPKHYTIPKTYTFQSMDWYSGEAMYRAWLQSYAATEREPWVPRTLNGESLNILFIAGQWLRT